MGYFLTKKFCESKLAKGRYFDKKVTDLYMRVGARKKTFNLRFRCPDTGKRREMVLGTVDAFSRKVLEETVATLKRRVMMGEQPGGKIRAEKRKGQTVKAIFDTVLDRLDRNLQIQKANNLPTKPAPSTIDKYRKTAKREFGPLNDMILEELEGSEISDWYQALLDTGKIAKANQSLDILRALITRAKEQKLIPKDFSGAEYIRQPYYKPKGARVLNAAEACRLWKYTEDLEPTERNAIRFQLLTATRMREAVQAKWEDIDLEKGVWVTVTKTFKEDDPLTIVLSSAAIRVLKEQKLANMSRLPDRNSPYVFPGGKNNRTKPYYDNMNPVLKKAAKDLGVDHISSHSLRKAASTIMAGQDVLPHIKEMVLGHVGNKIEKTYDKEYYMMKKREAVELLAEAVKTGVLNRDKNPESGNFGEGPRRS